MKIDSFGISSKVSAAGELAHCNLKPAARYDAGQGQGDVTKRIGTGDVEPGWLDVEGGVIVERGVREIVGGIAVVIDEQPPRA